MQRLSDRGSPVGLGHYDREQVPVPGARPHRAKAIAKLRPLLAGGRRDGGSSAEAGCLKGGWEIRKIVVASQSVWRPPFSPQPEEAPSGALSQLLT